MLLIPFGETIFPQVYLNSNINIFYHNGCGKQDKNGFYNTIFSYIISSVIQLTPVDVGLQIELHTKTVIGDISLYGDGQL